MPLLYGEGQMAFIRLQEEILRTSNDQSIFAWSADKTCGFIKFWILEFAGPVTSVFQGLCEVYASSRSGKEY